MVRRCPGPHSAGKHRRSGRRHARRQVLVCGQSDSVSRPWGSALKDWKIENGSGLSRTERITAHSLGQLLEAAWRQPWMPEFVSSMAMAGVDGTARKRLRDSPARRLRAHQDRHAQRRPRNGGLCPRQQRTPPRGRHARQSSQRVGQSRGTGHLAGVGVDGGQHGQPRDGGATAAQIGQHPSRTAHRGRIALSLPPT